MIGKIVLGLGAIGLLAGNYRRHNAARMYHRHEAHTQTLQAIQALEEEGDCRTAYNLFIVARANLAKAQSEHQWTRMLKKDKRPRNPQRASDLVIEDFDRLTAMIDKACVIKIGTKKSWKPTGRRKKSIPQIVRRQD